jgi:hypothetical protein
MAMQERITSAARDSSLPHFIGIMEWWTEIGSWEIDTSDIMDVEPEP